MTTPPPPLADTRSRIESVAHVLDEAAHGRTTLDDRLRAACIASLRRAAADLAATETP